MAKKRRTKTAEMATAYHEAGHVMATWLIKGLRAVGKVTIEPDGGSLGAHISESMFKKMDDPETEISPGLRLRLEHEIIVSLSGPAAQRLFNPRSVRHYHGRKDRGTAIDLASYVAGPNEIHIEAYLKWMDIRTMNFVKYNWPQIEDLAKELLRRRTMKRKELRQWLLHWIYDESNSKRNMRNRAKLDREYDKLVRSRNKRFRSKNSTKAYKAR